jgi:outer membrane immunogenic protein
LSPQPSALAADLPARTYTKAPVYVEPVYDWTGFYIGLNGGYSWGNSSNTFTAGTLPVTTASQHMNGWVFGGQAGYNWQFNRSWVFGIEGDIDATGQDGTATLAPNTTVTTIVPPPPPVRSRQLRRRPRRQGPSRISCRGWEPCAEG